MRKLNAGWTFVLGAIVLGAAAAAISVAFVRSMAPTEAVVVYARRVAPGEVLDREAARLASLPAARLADDTLRDRAAAVGKMAVLGGLPGEPVRKAALAALDGVSGPLAARLAAGPEGRVAYPVPGETAGGMGSQLHPGDRVDVFAVLDLPVKVDGKNVATMPSGLRVLAGVPVLMLRDPSGSGPGSGGVVVLSLTPQEAARLSLARAKGPVYLALTRAPSSGDVLVGLDKLYQPAGPEPPKPDSKSEKQEGKNDGR